MRRTSLSSFQPTCAKGTFREPSSALQIGSSHSALCDYLSRPVQTGTGRCLITSLWCKKTPSPTIRETSLRSSRRSSSTSLLRLQHSTQEICLQKEHPSLKEGCQQIPIRVLESHYIASEPPSPSGQGPLPRAVLETSSLPKTGAFHFTISLLSVRTNPNGLFILNGKAVPIQHIRSIRVVRIAPAS